MTPPNSPDCVGDQIANPCLGYCEYRTGAPIDVVSRAKKSVSFSENICYHSPYSSPHHSPQKMPLSLKPTVDKSASSRPTGLCGKCTTGLCGKCTTGLCGKSTTECGKCATGLCGKCTTG